MTEVYRVDEEGFLIEVVLQDENTNDCITLPPPTGMSKPRWNGTEWVDTQNVEIQKLKSQLEQSDYMIIKCYEYQFAGKELPYNLDALHRDRQTMRDKINQLER